MLATFATSAVLGQGPFSVDEMLRPYDRAIDGRYDADEALRYRIVQGERISGWSCDPTGPYYAEDKHLCPAECRGNYYDPKLRANKRKKFERMLFTGKIVAWLPETSVDPALWKVEYTDGDVEDLEDHEVVTILVEQEWVGAESDSSDSDTEDDW